MDKALKQIVKNLQHDYPKLSLFEALQIAVQIRRNDLISFALGAYPESDTNPTFLEAISIALGYKRYGWSTVCGSLDSISEAIAGLTDNGENR